MLLPYLTKFKCSGCDKWHRMGFGQWLKMVEEQGAYLALHKKASGNTQVAIERTSSKFGTEMIKSGWQYRLGKWFIDKI